MKKTYVLLATVALAGLISSACKSKSTGSSAGTEGANGADRGAMTFLGTPRRETLMVDNLEGMVSRPDFFNPYAPGVDMTRGFHELCTDNLWEINTTRGEQFPSLAAEMPKALNKEWTSFQIQLRPGIFWDDGIEFTSDDVVFTFQTWLNQEKLPIHAWAKDYIKSVKAEGKYTVILETSRPQPRLSKDLGVTIWDNRFKPLAKHIWEKQDPTTYNAFPPVCLGQYKYMKHDPNGNWTAWQLREDWQRTSVGIIAKKSGPKYVVWNFVGTEEKRILAMLDNQLDILQDITPESMHVLLKKSKAVHAWYTGFPYADMDDPCERGIAFNDSTPPYDQWQVRWALALATDIKKVSLGTFSGMLRVSPLGVPPITAVQNVYHKPLVERLQALTLPDGYKPFDPHFAKDMADTLKQQGAGADLPTDPNALVDLFGVGWWKYDVAEAAKLLESVGFKKDPGGKWLLPDGKPWTIAINAPADFEVESGRLAFAVADAWTKFGVETTAQPMSSGSFGDANATGKYQAGAYWPGCAIGADIYPNVNNWHQKHFVETGKPAFGNRHRLRSEKISSLLDQLETISADDPKNVELSKNLLLQMAQEMHWIPMFGTSKFVPVNDTYFTHYPTAKDSYEGPWWWWSNFKFIVANIEPKK